MIFQLIGVRIMKYAGIKINADLCMLNAINMHIQYIKKFLNPFFCARSKAIKHIPNATVCLNPDMLNTKNVKHVNIISDKTTSLENFKIKCANGIINIRYSIAMKNLKENPNVLNSFIKKT